ncbi:hypothetical protein ACK3YX_09550, partial [Aeromonas caviae]
THDEPFFMAPDDKHDLISGTCSHLPYRCDGKGQESLGSFDAATVIAAAKMGDWSNVLAVIY